MRASPTRLHFSLRFSRSWRKSPKSAAGRTNINNGMIMNQIVREKPISYWPTGANDWPAVYLHSASPLALSALFPSLSHCTSPCPSVSPTRSFSLVAISARCARSLQPILFPAQLTHFFSPFFPRVAFPLAAVSLQRHERDRTTHTVHIFQLI